MKIHVYHITIFIGSEAAGTLLEVYSCNIALRDPTNLERVAKDILEEKQGDEVTCSRVTTCTIMD